MKPIKITLSAFGPYAKKQCIDFSKLGERSLFLIHGRTGAGKTSILDAMSYALYGVSSGDRKGKQMRSDHAAASAMTEVSFEFSLGPKRYRVTRRPEQERQKKRGEGTTLERNAATLFELNADGTEKAVLADQWSKVTEKIEGIFGFKADQFRQVVLLPQGSFRRLLLAPSKDREQILQSLFHTHVYRSIEEQLKKEAKDLKEDLESLGQQKSELLHARNVESLEELRTKLSEERRQLKRWDAQLKSLRAKTEEWNEKLGTARQELRAWERAQEAQQQHQELLAKKPAFDISRVRLAHAARAEPLKAEFQRLTQLESQTAELNTALKAVRVSVLKAQGELDQRGTSNPFLEVAKSKTQELIAFESTLKRAGDLEEQRIKARALEARRAELAKGLSSIKEEQLKAKIELEELAERRSLRDQGEERLRGLFSERQCLESTLAQFQKQDDLLQSLALEETKLAALKASFKEFKESLQSLRVQWLQKPQSNLCKELIGKESAWLSKAEKVLAQERVLLRLEAQLKSEPSAPLNRDELADRLESVVQALTKAQAELSKIPEDSNEQELALREHFQKLQRESERLHDDLESCKGQISLLNDFFAENADTASNESLEALEDKRDELRLEYEGLERQEQTWSRETERLRAQVGEACVLEQSREEAWSRSFEQLTEHRECFSRALEKAGFQCPEDLAHQQLESEDRERLSKALSLFEAQLAAAKISFEESQKAIAHIEEAPDLELFEKQALESQRALEQSIARRSAHSMEVEQSSRSLARLIKLERKVKRLRGRYQDLGHLSEVASGKNDYRLSFQRFVLAALLDDVLLNASEHLQRMSKGRFQLQRARLRHDKRLTGGLDLEIYDGYTGTCRAVPTLSGGESFLAALSLALGLADVVQSHSGGIHLETIFVDEGFGSLDPESLDLALDTFIDLQKGGRLVGIISHVPELKERIEARLTVTSTRSGSFAKFN